IVRSSELDLDRRLMRFRDGEIDFLQDVPLDRVARLRGIPGTKLVQAGSLLTMFLGFDQGSTELHSSDIKGRNPFADRRDRQALYQAINIDKLIKTALGGLAKPVGMMAVPGVNGYDPELDQRLPYDPERAKELLSEAGYDKGFAVRFDCPAQRREACPELAAQ